LADASATVKKPLFPISFFGENHALPPLVLSWRAHPHHHFDRIADVMDQAETAETPQDCGPAIRIIARAMMISDKGSHGHGKNLATTGNAV
jgi:hypothetical protein